MNNIREGVRGRYIRQTVSDEHGYFAYVPPALPPELDMARHALALTRASTALGRLDGIVSSSAAVPSVPLILYTFVRKEAVISSQIEGTQSSLSDLLQAELPTSDLGGHDAGGVPVDDDIAEVSSYVDAIYYSLERVKELPISGRLLRDIHVRLMGNTRGSTKQPGEFRTSQNWLGGVKPSSAIFVPPPPSEIAECISDFEKYYNTSSRDTPELIKAAIIHAQFETIHPFLDGNGRLGRLLITLVLCSEGILREPLLYLSLFFKKHRTLYYDRLQGVRDGDDWDAWVEFFLEGVEEMAEKSHQLVEGLLNLFDVDRKRIIEGGKVVKSAVIVHEVFQEQPLANLNLISQKTKLTKPTIQRAIDTLESLGIIRDITTSKQRRKIYIYKAYLTMLNEDI